MKRRRLLVSVLVVSCLASLTWARSGAKQLGSPDSGPFKSTDGTSQFRRATEMLRHARNQARIQAAGPSGPIQSQDVGDVAVIVDNGSIFIPPKPDTPFDLATPTAIRWTPNGAGAFDAAFSATPMDGTLGNDLGLGDDTAAPVEAADSLTFPGFPYLGTTYTTDNIFVGSDGHITLGAPEASSNARDAGRLVGGPPRIAPFFDDLNPDAGGAVFADVRADRVVLTWSGLPEFGLTNSNTFQAVLHASGAIDFVYSNIEASYAVVGLAVGNGAGPFTELDLSADLPVANVAVGAVFEEFSPAILVQQMDVVALAEEFYRTHSDDYDFLVMFSDEVVDIGGGAFAFNATLHSDTEGLGFFDNGSSSVFDACGLVGLSTGCELESLVNMNRIGLYWPDEGKLVNPPIQKFRFFCFNVAGQIVPCGATFGGPPGADQLSLRARWMGTLNGDFGSHGSYTLGLNSAMSIMGQEAGHRWLAFPLVINPAFQLSTALLGRSSAHWSFFFNVTVPPEQFEDGDGDPRASSAEGNAIADLGPDPRCPAGSSLFQTRPNELIDGFTELDQYFLGVRKPADVPPFWYISNPTVIFGGGPNASSSARDDVLICGNRVDRVLTDITDIGDVFLPFLPSNGTRDPLIGDEQDAGPGIGPADVDRCTNDRECVDVKTMAFILLVGNGTPASQRYNRPSGHFSQNLGGLRQRSGYRRPRRPRSNRRRQLHQEVRNEPQSGDPLRR